MTELKVIQSWSREALESAFTQREVQLSESQKQLATTSTTFDQASKQAEEYRKQLAMEREHTGTVIFRLDAEVKRLEAERDAAKSELEKMRASIPSMIDRAISDYLNP